MLVSNKEISRELVSLCFGKEIMAEQNAVAAAKSELTLAVSHSAAASESATFDTYSGALIIHELSPENSLKFPSAFGGVLILYLCYFQGLRREVKSFRWFSA